jgi:AraC-like DNA-binding protein
MNYYTVKPSSRLADYVRYFWVFEGTLKEKESFTLRTPASGYPQLLFHYRGIFNDLSHNHHKLSFSSGIHGQTHMHRIFSISENFGMIGVHLYPYSLKTWFNLPTIEFTNQLPDLDSILNPAEISLSERVLEAKNNQERILIISDFLESKIKTSVKPEIVYTVKEIIQANGNISIKKLLSDVSLSQRQFERTFKEQVGFSAKLFARIIRFNSLITKSDWKEKSLTEIALDFGYYDQSHFIHEFKEFSGVNPKTYFSEKVNQGF